MLISMKSLNPKNRTNMSIVQIAEITIAILVSYYYKPPIVAALNKLP